MPWIKTKHVLHHRIIRSVVSIAPFIIIIIIIIIIITIIIVVFTIIASQASSETQNEYITAQHLFPHSEPLQFRFFLVGLSSC